MTLFTMYKYIYVYKHLYINIFPPLYCIAILGLFAYCFATLFAW